MVAPDLSLFTVPFTAMSVFGLEWIFGAMLALLLTMAVSRDISKWKVIYLPMYVGLGIVGVKISWLVLISATFIFINNALSVDILGSVVSLARNAPRNLFGETKAGTTKWDAKKGAFTMTERKESKGLLGVGGRFSGIGEKGSVTGDTRRLGFFLGDKALAARSPDDYKDIRDMRERQISGGMFAFLDKDKQLPQEEFTSYQNVMKQSDTLGRGGEKMTIMGKDKKSGKNVKGELNIRRVPLHSVRERYKTGKFHGPYPKPYGPMTYQEYRKASERSPESKRLSRIFDIQGERQIRRREAKKGTYFTKKGTTRIEPLPGRFRFSNKRPSQQLTQREKEYMRWIRSKERRKDRSKGRLRKRHGRLINQYK